MKRQLLIGCGSSRAKLFNPQEPWEELETLDINRDHQPNWCWDLNRHPLPFPDNSYDEIHAYDCLEHVGQQGDAPRFFAEFQEYWRILKPDGLLFGVVPAWDSFWAWSDPSHRRVISEGTLTFLSQEHYKQIGDSPSSDYRNIYKGDLRMRQYQYRPRTGVENERCLYFVLQAVKR